MLPRAFYAFLVVNAQMILSARWERTRGRVRVMAPSPELHEVGMERKLDWFNQSSLTEARIFM
jgi:hypothetical protein